MRPDPLVPPDPPVLQHPQSLRDPQGRQAQPIRSARPVLPAPAARERPAADRRTRPAGAIAAARRAFCGMPRSAAGLCGGAAGAVSFWREPGRGGFFACAAFFCGRWTSSLSPPFWHDVYCMRLPCEAHFLFRRKKKPLRSRKGLAGPPPLKGEVGFIHRARKPRFSRFASSPRPRRPVAFAAPHAPFRRRLFSACRYIPANIRRDRPCP